MYSKNVSKAATHGRTGNGMSNLHPGRSAKPPAFSLKASSSNDKLSGSIGRGGDNHKEDLLRFALLLKELGAPKSFIMEATNPMTNGFLIEKYQAQVLKFKNPDGRIDPGGKTEKSIRNGEGREKVARWYQTKKQSLAKEQGREVPVAELGQAANWIYPPLLTSDDYISQSPPSSAQGVNTLTKAQLFSHGTAMYGPNGEKDIQKPGNWKKHYRWKRKGPWSSYEEALNQTYWIGCHTTCIYMAEKAGVTGVNNNSTWNSRLHESQVKGQTAVDLIDPQLKSGSVVVVRVKNNGHSILIVGKGKDEKGEFYYYFDPGRTSKAGYSLENNRMYVSDGKISGGSKNYALSQVRESISA